MLDSLTISYIWFHSPEGCGRTITWGCSDIADSSRVAKHRSFLFLRPCKAPTSAMKMAVIDASNEILSITRSFHKQRLFPKRNRYQETLEIFICLRANLKSSTNLVVRAWTRLDAWIRAVTRTRQPYTSEITSNIETKGRPQYWLRCRSYLQRWKRSSQQHTRSQIPFLLRHRYEGFMKNYGKMHRRTTSERLPGWLCRYA